MTPFLLEMVAVLLVAAIVATFGYTSGKRAVQKKIDDACIHYMLQLEDLIRNSVKEGEYKAALSRNSTERPFYAAFLIC
jgi:hypothetical protein